MPGKARSAWQGQVREIHVKLAASAISRTLPFLLTGFIIAADQVTKTIVASRLLLARPVEVLGDFLRFTYVLNPAVAFSLGRKLPSHIQRIVFFLLPLLVLCIVLLYYFLSHDLTNGQRWALAAILGGGSGNLLDRLVRSGGVVDFIDVKFYGILGFARFPTFNLADSSVSVAGLFLIFSFLRHELRREQ